MCGLKKNAILTVKMQVNIGTFQSIKILMLPLIWKDAPHVLNIMLRQPKNADVIKMGQELFDTCPNIALMVNKKGVVLTGNKALSDRLGCDIDKIKNNILYHFFPANVAIGRKKAIEKAFLTRNSVCYRDINNQRHFNHLVTPLKGSRGDYSYAIIFSSDVTDNIQNENTVKLLSGTLLTAIDAERKKIACDLHDECSQLLSVIGMGLNASIDLLPTDADQVKRMLRDYLNAIERLSAKIRFISSNLYPDLIDILGIVPAIEWYLDMFFKNISVITCIFKNNFTQKSLGEEIDIILYRIIQEGVSNIIKHAHATKIIISLLETDTTIALTIQDNGIGFTKKKIFPPTDSDPKGIGLLIMQQRIASIGGRLEIETAAGKGTTLRAIIDRSEKG
ncbi:MAG: ATP-binding protein [Pseudomonadota bacterium]